MRMYRANAAIPPAQHARRVEVPSGFSLFPGDIVRPPRAWLERTANVVRVTEPPRGGHFAPFEEPELYAAGAARVLPPLPHDQVKPTLRKKCPSRTFPTPPPAQCTSRAKRMMATMHTTSQKKKMTIPGIAYPPIVLARAMAPGYPDPPEIFRHEKNQNLYLERSVPAAPLARHNHLPRGLPIRTPPHPPTIATGRPGCCTMYSRVRMCLPEL